MLNKNNRTQQKENLQNQEQGMNDEKSVYEDALSKLDENEDKFGGDKELPLKNSLIK